MKVKVLFVALTLAIAGTSLAVYAANQDNKPATEVSEKSSCCKSKAAGEKSGCCKSKAAGEKSGCCKSKK